MQDKHIKYQCFGGTCYQLVEPYHFETSIGIPSGVESLSATVEGQMLTEMSQIASVP